MGKFPEADREISNIVICRKCKARNKKGRDKCRKCGASADNLRPKRKEIRAKK